MKKAQAIIYSSVIAGVIGLGMFAFLNGKSKQSNEPASSQMSSTTIPQKSQSSSSNQHSKTSESTKGTAMSIEQRMSEMSIEEKVGQLFFVRMPELQAIEDVKTYHLSGFVLFGRDIEHETTDSLKEKIADIQEATKTPLLIGVDEEGGTVTRLSRNPALVDPPFLSPQALYAAGGWDAISEDTRKKAEILKSFGIQTGLFPVADVATDQDAFIYDRTIGMDAIGTSRYVETVVAALNQAQSGSTLKHFPGYGNNRDSHVEIVTDTRPIEQLRKEDYLPFEAGIKAGAQSILVSHNIIQAIDGSVPASISPAVHEVIRKELGFDGVVMTDDMDMAGLASFTSQEEAGVAALKAGNDLVMSSSYQSQIPAVLEAITKGAYSEEQLNASVRRVLNWKTTLGLLASD